MGWDLIIFTTFRPFLSLDKNTSLKKRFEDAAYRQLYLPDDAAHRAPPFRVRPARWNRSVKRRKGTKEQVPEASSSFKLKI